MKIIILKILQQHTVDVIVKKQIKFEKRYDEFIEKLKKFNLNQIAKLFKNNNLGKRQLNSTFKIIK